MTYDFLKNGAILSFKQCLEYEILGFEKLDFKVFGEVAIENLMQKRIVSIFSRGMASDVTEISFRSIFLVFEGFLVTTKCEAVKKVIECLK